MVDVRHGAFEILEADEREPLAIRSGHTAIEVKNLSCLLCRLSQNSWNWQQTEVMPFHAKFTLQVLPCKVDSYWAHTV